MEGIYGKIFKLAGPYLDTRDNDLHTRIAYSFALKLLEAEGGDEKIVIPAVLLHDVGWKTVPEELQLKAFGPGRNDLEINRIHEVEGAKIARELLQQAGYDPELVDQIVEIILEHDSRHEAISHNDALVKDSDKLCEVLTGGNPGRSAAFWCGPCCSRSVAWISDRRLVPHRHRQKHGTGRAEVETSRARQFGHPTQN